MADREEAAVADHSRQKGRREDTPPGVAAAAEERLGAAEDRPRLGAAEDRPRLGAAAEDRPRPPGGREPSLAVAGILENRQRSSCLKVLYTQLLPDIISRKHF